MLILECGGKATIRVGQVCRPGESVKLVQGEIREQIPRPNFSQEEKGKLDSRLAVQQCGNSTAEKYFKGVPMDPKGPKRRMPLG
jgi:hypothetical protein